MSSTETDEDGPGVAPHGGLLRRTFMKHPFWVATIAGLLFFPALKLCSIRHEPPLPHLGQIAATPLVDVHGAPLDPTTLGGPWFAAMVEAGDGRITPALLGAVAELQRRLAREGYEVPAVILFTGHEPRDEMLEIANRHSARDRIVHFLSGPAAGLKALRTGLEPGLGPVNAATGAAARIALIDAKGAIRAGSDIGALGLDELTRAALTFARARGAR